MSNVNVPLRLRRGNQADLDAYTLQPGEPGFSLDQHRLFIGTDDSKVEYWSRALVEQAIANAVDGLSSGASGLTESQVNQLIANYQRQWGDIVGKPAFSDAATTSVSTIRSGVTKESLGLGNVENLSSAELASSIAQTLSGSEVLWSGSSAPKNTDLTLTMSKSLSGYKLIAMRFNNRWLLAMVTEVTTTYDMSVQFVTQTTTGDSEQGYTATTTVTNLLIRRSADAELKMQTGNFFNNIRITEIRGL